MNKQISASIAVVGLAATVALYNMSAEQTSLYQTSDVITSAERQFMQYMAEYGKTYGTKAEYQFRLNEFSKKLVEIEEHNSRNGETSTMGINIFMDYTKEEMKRMNGAKPDNLEGFDEVKFDTSNLADEVNWFTAGAVTPVKNQGQCGSCWAFSATGGLEGAHFIATGELVSLSESQIVDCTIAPQEGCNGGYKNLAIEYSEKNPIELETDYPYVAQDGKCAYNKSKGVVSAKGYSHVPQFDPDQLKAAISQVPVTVSIEASQSVFQLYTGGVLTSAACGTNLDHAVLAVGYGTEDGQEYYLVKNSWGPAWGDQGFIKIGVTPGPGICGIQASPIFATM